MGIGAGAGLDGDVEKEGEMYKKNYSIAFIYSERKEEESCNI